MTLNKTVLVVEDDGDLREAICDLLQEQDYQAVGVAHGLAALEYLRRAPHPGLILLDLMMPTMDGWQFREAQLNDPKLCEIPVVVMTAGGHFLRAHPIRVDDIMLKPVSFKEVVQRLERYCA